MRLENGRWYWGGGGGNRGAVLGERGTTELKEETISDFEETTNKYKQRDGKDWLWTALWFGVDFAVKKTSMVWKFYRSKLF